MYFNNNNNNNNNFIIKSIFFFFLHFIILFSIVNSHDYKVNNIFFIEGVTQNIKKF